PLTGTGAAVPAPVVSLSAPLAFGNQNTGTTSAPQTVTVSNTGNANLVVSGVTLGGTNPDQFAQTNTCTTVAAGGSCTVSVTFTPSATDTRTAELSIASNAAGSPASVALSGTGAPLPTTTTLSATSAAFPAQRINTTSGNKTVTIKNTGANPLIVNPAIVIGF